MDKKLSDSKGGGAFIIRTPPGFCYLIIGSRSNLLLFTHTVSHTFYPLPAFWQNNSVFPSARCMFLLTLKGGKLY